MLTLDGFLVLEIKDFYIQKKKKKRQCGNPLSLLQYKEENNILHKEIHQFSLLSNLNAIYI